MPQVKLPGQIPAGAPKLHGPQVQATGPSLQGGHLRGPQAHVTPASVQAPKMQAPHLQTPPMTAMAVPKPKGGISTNTILVVIMVLLAFLAGGLIVFLLARK
jgi:hypothetical protein